ncbi:MAG: sugar transferase, partial [Acidobacteria bacterium]|nr:sugar transferase [Acidobacteriota bacterium]
MHRLRRSVLLQGLMAFDTLAVVAAFALGMYVSSAEGRWPTFGDFLSVRIRLGNFLLTLAFLAACRGIFEQCGLYRSRRLGRQRELRGQISKAFSLAVLLLLVLRLLFRIEAFGLGFLATFWLAGVSVVAAGRVGLYRGLEALRRRGRNVRHVVIVGAGPRGRRYAEELESRAELGYRVAGFLDEGPAGAAAGARLRGGFEDLVPLLRAEPVDEVVVALPLRTYYSEIAKIVAQCEQLGVVVRLPGDLFAARLAQTESEQYEELSVVTLFTGRGSALSLAAKRAADVALAAAAIVLLAPLLALIAIAIRLDSPGPVMFRQLRAGRNGRRFRMRKFRTMGAGAETRQAELEH